MKMRRIKGRKRNNFDKNTGTWQVSLVQAV